MEEVKVNEKKYLLEEREAAFVNAILKLADAIERLRGKLNG